MKQILSSLALAVIFSNIAVAQNINFEHDGLTRQYRIHVPSELPESPALVIAMHGYSGNNNEMMNDYGWTELADERGFVIAFPNGTRDQSNNRFWDVDYSFHAGIDIDDDGFIRELALHLQQLHGTDLNKIYATGFSNGAEMSFQLACRESETITAFAPIVGMMMDTLFTDCNPAVVRPILSLNGTADNTTLWNGDMNDTGGWGPYHSIPNTMALWASIMDVEVTDSYDFPDTNPNDGSTVHRDIYSSPNHESELWFYTVNGGGHDWPGSWGNMDIHSAIEVWNFFDGLSVAPCLGDLDGSNTVDVEDLLALLSEYGTCTGECAGDLDSDGDVDVSDLLLIIDRWGAACDAIVKGACCTQSETCEFITSIACDTIGGLWNGGGSSCMNTICSTSAFDECADAMTISLGATGFSTAEASNSIDPYDDSTCSNSYLGVLNADIWFSYEAVCGGFLTVSTCDTATFDTDLVMYEGACGNLQQIACNGDDDACSEYTSRFSVNITSGETYLIRVGGWETGQAGTGTLTLDCTE
jgi:polyhydroxybutyrate depolymerase